VVKAFSLQRRTSLVHHAQQPGSRQNRFRGVPLNDGRAFVTISVLLLHLVVLAIGAYLAPRARSRWTFVTFESAFWEVSTTSPCDAFHPGCRSRPPRRCVTSRSCSTSDPRRRSSGRLIAAHHQRHHFRPRDFWYDGNETPVLDNLSLKLNVGKTIAIVGRAARARARCST